MDNAYDQLALLWVECNAAVDATPAELYALYRKALDEIAEASG